MATTNDNNNLGVQPDPAANPAEAEAATAQADLFDEYPFVVDEELDLEDEAFLASLLDYDEQPLLLVDTDPERAVARQKELMDTVFDGIGEERKEEKRNRAGHATARRRTKACLAPAADLPGPG
ncbi:MAG: hypothetical protein HS126_37140 [Anaerolineales bacterium]|nr:hypothetical protein [Anaerolineales bacterium]